MADESFTKGIIILISINLILAFLLWLLLRTLPSPEIFIQTPYQPANIIIDVSATQGPMHPFWQGLAQGGEEVRPDMLSAAIPVLASIKPSYIRLDHVFDDDFYTVVSCSGSNLRFDWTKLDVAVADIRSTGALPFFSLSYMPGCLAENKIAKPRDYDQWYSLVKALVEHYSGQTEGIYYEVWNEPDLEVFGGWKTYGSKNYLELYEASVRGAMDARQTKRFYVGGPATTGLYKNWMESLYSFAGQKGLRLDFFSWHTYSDDPYQYSQEVDILNAWFSGKPIPRLVISEWGPTPVKSTKYSSDYSAAHLVAVVRQLIDKVSLSTAFEVKDGPGQQNMGWGILYHETNGLAPKPRYKALEWLSEVRGNRFALIGEGSNVTGFAFGSNKKFSILLTNFGPDASLEGVPISIVGLEDGNWNLVRELLGQGTTESAVVITGGRLDTTLGLEPNQLGRIILTKL